ncbi:serine/threonine-protein kinase CST20-like isoform X2 [Andrographis paniculata]|uniref:serine/threonine-protein kinase CST20-like isoform X2 n=1 Tax=Andrographis paniculata TaxID=175694 RepID=UPI0021E7F635|nr:serine/threonine-protein kinase CST20-like isoform X2 [Andrographis paniculata]
MRIRRSANRSLLHTTSSAPPIICQLNQNPWDVADFSPPSSPPPPPPPPPPPSPPQFDVSSFSAGNGSSPAGNLLSQREIKQELKRPLQHSKRAPGKIVMCNKTDGKKWKCRREAVESHTLCEHHLSLSKNSSSSRAAGKSLPEKNKKAAAPESSNTSKAPPAPPSDYYYYSGFGPRWGKNRAEIAQPEQQQQQPPNEEDDQMEVDSSSDDEENEKRRKRGRKPVKARSLKSLM